MLIYFLEVPVLFQKPLQMLKTIAVYCMLYNVGSDVP